MAASILLLVVLVTVCHVSAREPHLGQRMGEERAVAASENFRALPLKEGQLLDHGRQLIGLKKKIKRKSGATITGPAKGKYFSKCPHPQTPAIMANLSSQLIARLASKGYTAAADAFNSTGVLMGIRHKANLLVPTNAAFENLPAAVTKLLQVDRSFVMKRIMREHMLKVASQFKSLARMKYYRTYLRTKLKATKTKSRTGVISLSFTPVNGYSTIPATVVAPDLLWSCFGHHQGVDHILIPSLETLTPPTPAESPASSPAEAISSRAMLESEPLLNSFQWKEVIE